MSRIMQGRVHAVQYLRTTGGEPVDRPDPARAVSRIVRSKDVDRGIMICGGSPLSACLAKEGI